MNEITVLVLERYPVGVGIANLLNERRGLRVVAAPAWDEAARSGEWRKPDIVLFDLATVHQDAGVHPLNGPKEGSLSAPSINGPAIRKLCRELAGTQVIVVYDDVERSELLDCLLAGAKGCIHRDQLPTDLEKAVRVVHRGEAWVSRRMVAEMIDRFCQAASGEGEPDAMLLRERKPAAGLPKILC